MADNRASTNNIIVTIQNTDITIKHENFSSLNIKRTASDAADSFTLNVLDDATFDIEYLLLNSNNKISVKYVNDSGEICKNLSGTVIKMKNSFVDNRNMLTLEGYVSLQTEDKYQPVSNSWNQIPIFEWKRFFDESYADDYLPYGEKGLTASGFFNEVIVDGVTSTIDTLKNMAGIHAEDWKDIIDRIFKENGIKVDDAGNYYIPSKYSNNDKDTLKSTGMLSLPMKPSEILKLVMFGGNYSDLFSVDKNTYKNYSEFWNQVSNIQFYFMQKWVEKMGERNALDSRYTIGKWSDTDYVVDDLTQTRESNFTYIYNTLLNKCIHTEDNGKTYANYYLTFNNIGDKIKVNLERLDASEYTNTASKTQYVYYGKFQPTENYGVMTSFSASIDVLTSMITNGSNTSKDADISSMNLITGETISVSIVPTSVDKDEDTDKLSTARWGEITYSLADSGSNNSSLRSIAKTFAVAEANCYKAEATITGFNTLEPLDFIDVIVLPTTLSDGSQLLHHTSGKYYILALEDNIENGNWTTKLSLIKNIQSTGKTAVTIKSKAASEKN